MLIRTRFVKRIMRGGWRRRSSLVSAQLTASSEQCTRKEFAVFFFVEPRAFDVEEPEAGDQTGQRERVDRELCDRPIDAGIRLVIQDVHGAVAHLKEVDVAGDAGIGRRIGAAQQNAVLALQLQDLGGREPDRHLDGERRRVVRQHEALERLVPQPIVADGRNDKRGHAGRLPAIILAWHGWKFERSDLHWAEIVASFRVVCGGDFRVVVCVEDID